MKVIIKGYWSPYCGSDYCEALGIYDSLEQAEDDAECRAWETWEPDQDENIEDEGPQFWVEEYNPEIHNELRIGGGSFEDDF